MANVSNLVKNPNPMDCFAGGGEMGAVMRVFNWSRTPLGPVESWPQSLRLAVSLCLNAPQPAVIWWGAALVTLYNDAYHALMGKSEALRSLGQPRREDGLEEADHLRPLIDKVFNQGKALQAQDQLLPVQPQGRREERYVSFAFNPIREETGQVAGVFATLTETTANVLNRRRLHALQKLAAHLGQAGTAEEICASAAETLAAYNADLPFTLFYLIDPDEVGARLAGAAGLAPGEAASPKLVELVEPEAEEYLFETSPWPLARVARTGQAALAPHLDSQLGPLPGGPWPESPQTAWVLPLILTPTRRPVGLLVAGISPRQKLDEAYRAFLELVAGQVAAALGRAQAAEQAPAEPGARKGEYPSLVEAVPIFIWQADSQGKLVYSSESFYDYTGLTEEEFMEEGWSGQGVVHPDDLPGMMAQWQHSLASRSPFEVEVRLRGADGIYRWHLNRGQLVENKAGKILGWIGSSTAIDEQKRTEEALREQARMLELVYVVVHDLEGRIIFWNQGAEQLYGWRREEALGRIAHDLLRTHFPEPLEKIKAQVLASGSWQGELTHTRQDGTPVMISSQWILHRDRQGNPFSILEINNDITRLKRTEAALRTAHMRNTHILNTMTDGFFMFDREWRYIYVNQSGLEQVHRTREMLLGRKVWEVFPNAVGTEVQRQWERAMTERVPVRFEYYYPNFKAWFDHRVYPAIEGVAVFTRDISEQKQAEQALRESEERFAKAFQASPDALAFTRPDGRIFEVNDTFERMFGFSRAEALGKTPIELKAYVEPAEYQKAGELFQAHGFLRNHELKLRNRAGEILYCHLSTLPVIINNEPCRLNIVRDVTEQKQAEVALQESHERLTSLVESISDTFTAIDRDWRLSYVNQHGLKVSGVTSAEEIVGRNFWELYPQLKGTTLEAAYRKAMEERVPVRFEVQGVVTGNWYETSVYPYADGISIFGRNITERKQAEAALQESEERFAKAFQVSPNALAISRQADGYILEINESWEKLFGYSREEAVGRTSAELGLYVDLADRQRMVEPVGRQGFLRNFELEMRLRSGEIRQVLVNIEPLKLGDEPYLFSVTRDVSEQKRTEAVLRQSEERFAKAFRASPDILVISRQADDRIFEINDSFEKILGYSQEEALGKDPDELNLFVDLAERQQARQLFRAQGFLREFELKLRNKAGEICHFSVSTELLHLDDGPYLLNIMRDISEQKQAEVALRQSEERFARAFRASPDAYAINRRQDGQFLEVNESWEKLFGYRREEVLGRTPLAVGLYADPADRTRVQELIQQHGSLRNFEMGIKRRSGETRRVSFSLETIEIDGESCLITILRDITAQKEAETALRQAHQQLQAHLDYTPLGVVEWDADFRIIRWAGEAETIFGWKAEEVLGKDVDDLPWVYEEDKAYVRGVAAALAQGQQVVSRNRNYDKWGRLHHCEWYNSVVMGPAGQMQSILSLVLDVTEQTVAEQARRESEELFTRAFQASPDILAINRYDGTILEVNPRFEQVFGYSREEAIGKTPIELNLYIDLEERHRSRERFDAQGFLRDYPVDLQTKSGEIRHIGLSIEKITLNNEPHLLTLIRDMTEQKQVERALQTSEKEFRTMFELAGSGKIQVDPVTSRFLRANRRYCEITGYSEEELLRMTAPEVTHPEDRDREHVLVRPVREGLRDHWQIEKRYLRKDGGVVWALVTGSLVRDEAGQPLHTIATVQDITALKETEAALRRARDELEQRVAERTADLERSLQDLSQFTYIASHDLKSPLRGIKQLAGWIVEDTAGLLPESARRHLDRMQIRVERMEKFLNDLLTYSRMGQGHHQHLEEVDTGALIREMVDLLAPPPGFRITIREPMPLLTGHRLPLEFTFRNLIENAIKHHHREEGRIEITASEQETFVEFTVTDDGPGINSAHHERIFQMFQTLYPKDEGGGTGAGLAIVKRAVESQGGTIGVTSAEGEGTTFRFTWPKEVRDE